MHENAYQCANGCNIFETVGVPSFCPHCGTREVLPSSDDLTIYETYDEGYINHGANKE